MPQTQIVNNFGVVTGWNQRQISVLGRQLVGVSKFMYKDSTETEVIMGAGPMPIGIGTGNYKAEVGMTLSKEEVDGILASLPAGSRIQDIPPFDVPMLTVRGGKVTKDVVRNVMFTGLGTEVSQGDKSTWYDMPMLCTHIDWNVQ